MLLVGLTGGIGSGKSTVSAGLAMRGAVVVDADRLARQVVQPGGGAYQPLVERFGSGVLHPDGSLDRPALAAVVFSDAAARADLDAMTHPAIRALIAEAVLGLADSPLVVLDLPLLSAKTVHLNRLGAVVVVDAPTDLAVERLVEQRGFDETDARARVAAQMSRSERVSLVERVPAGLVLDNSGDLTALEREVARAWDWISGVIAGADPPRR